MAKKGGMANPEVKMVRGIRVGIILLLLLASIIALALAGCSGGSTKDEPDESISPSASQNGETESGSEGTPTPTAEPTPTEEPIKAIVLSEVRLSPVSAELRVEETRIFSATALDGDGNPLPDAQIGWEAGEGAGSIAADGVFTAGIKAGTYEQGVVATATLGGVSVKGTASITINPGTPASVEIVPIEVAAGETEQLEFVVKDTYGNPVSGMEGKWTISDENAGVITESGVLNVGEVARTFADTVKVEVKHGEETLTTLASVTIVPGPLDQVVIGPNPAEIGMGMKQQFIAVGADEYGNRISGLSYVWSVEKGGGSIDKKGLFTAGTKPDKYADTVKVVASQGETSCLSTVTVTVEPDRIAYISWPEEQDFDIQLMNADGNNKRRLATTSLAFALDWSPDGRRIVYDSISQTNMSIVAMNDDGSWPLTMVYESYPWMPAWSPDGTKLAYSAYVAETDNYEIFVSNVDGGNPTQITHVGTDEMAYFPSWSPDGKRIAYEVCTPTDDSAYWGPSDLCVINGDGTNDHRLTTSPLANDAEPVWSPDGSKIIFSSGQDGDYDVYTITPEGFYMWNLTQNYGIDDRYPSWSPDGSQIVFASDRDIAGRDSSDIYIMSASGGSATRLTNDTTIDRTPRWAPRKAGVEVKEDSLVIPYTSALKRTMTEKEVNAKARGAVVRIETDLGSGSGFIIDPNGLIMTNNHVIVDAKEITVYLDNSTSYKATVKNRDMVRDLAVIKIDAKDLPSLEFGDVGALEMGDRVIVLGYPLDSDKLSITGGLVSAVDFDKGRGVTLIKTDSAINFGNSGGPLLNLQGQVVGVVSLKYVGVGIEGIGYAISANTVKACLPDLTAE